MDVGRGQKDVNTLPVSWGESARTRVDGLVDQRVGEAVRVVADLTVVQQRLRALDDVGANVRRVAGGVNRRTRELRIGLDADLVAAAPGRAGIRALRIGDPRRVDLARRGRIKVWPVAVDFHVRSSC